MKISKKAYLAALLSDIRILVSPESWLRRHKDLLSRYVDIGAVCSLLREADRGILGRASALSGLETAPASSNIRQSLQSVFCRLRVSKDDDTQAQYYPCCPLTLTAPFPGAPCRELPDDVLVPLDRELETAAQNPPKSADDFFILLDTLLKKHLWCVPAESGPGVDVSLYDKMRSTSAIAVCLEDAGGSQEPFLLLAADFSGIQNYIFAVARTNVKGVAKRLRARSFLVDAMIQSLAYQICEKTEVPYGNILMLTGGKFYILL